MVTKGEPGASRMRECEALSGTWPQTTEGAGKFGKSSPGAERVAGRAATRVPGPHWQRHGALESRELESPGEGSSRFCSVGCGTSCGTQPHGRDAASLASVPREEHSSPATTQGQNLGPTTVATTKYPRSRLRITPSPHSASTERLLAFERSRVSVCLQPMDFRRLGGTRRINRGRAFPRCRTALFVRLPMRWKEARLVAKSQERNEERNVRWGALRNRY